MIVLQLQSHSFPTGTHMDTNCNIEVWCTNEYIHWLTPSQDDASNDGSETESVIEDFTVPWPVCMTLVWVKGAKNLSLKIQQHQVKLAIHKTMGYIKEQIIFDNAFPSLQIQMAWNCDGMVHTCDEIANFASCHVQCMYDCIASRIQGDAYYLKAISLLVCIPPSIHYMISQTIYFRLMYMLAFFVVIPKQLQWTMSNHLASMSILASTSKRSMTFCTNFNTYIQRWSVIIVWLSPLVTNIFRVQMLMYQSHTKIQS